MPDSSFHTSYGSVLSAAHEAGMNDFHMFIFCVWQITRDTVCLSAECFLLASADLLSAVSPESTDIFSA